MHAKEPERLIQEYENYDMDNTVDVISFVAREIEDAMLQCGGVPGKDYTFLDVFKLAMQFAAGCGVAAPRK